MATKRKKAVKSKRATKSKKPLDCNEGDIQLPPGIIFSLNTPEADGKTYTVKGIDIPTIKVTKKGKDGVVINMRFEVEQTRFSRKGFCIPKDDWNDSIAFLAFEGRSTKIKLAEILTLFVSNPETQAEDEDDNMHVDSGYDIIAGKIGGGAGLKLKKGRKK